MSDLISRSELLKAMDTWDKFGYDEHNRLIKIDRTNEEYVPYVHYEDMVNCVNDMPTAYSVDRVVDKLEEIRTKKTCNKEKCDTKELCRICVVDDAIEIVKEVAEEYTSTEHINCSTNTSTNGWIPCSERLPEEGEDVLVWYEYFRYGNFNCMYQTYGIGYHYDGHWGGDVSGANAKCIAWQPLPEPFKERD